jgi:hypothetical protein
MALMPTANGETVVRVRLKGINTVRAKLADGTVKTYYYHKLSGRRISGEPGTPAFLASIAEAEVAAKSVSGHLFRAIIVGYRTAPELQNLRPQTQKDYRRVSPQEIATITGHSLTTVDAILDKYSGRTLPLAEMAMAKLEKGLAGTFGEQIQQNASKTAKRRPTNKDLSA